uniref:Odorant binding protein n=1 Tax=Athetis dissimilis TaxID=1737331 RepID=A0A4D6QBF8_ATHDI|nr:odorant binding protein [Athetis dissimilis]
MSKFTCFLLCIVAMSLSSVHVARGEKSLRDALRPVIVACSQEHGVTDAEIQAAKDAGSPETIKPCFIACVFKKAGFINDKGELDLETGLKNLRQFVKNEEQYNKYENVAKECVSVKDKPVTDGKAGCERGALLAACFLDHRASIII